MTTQVDDIPLEERRKLWVAALRSGDYQQGQGFLCSLENDKPYYCCLGIAIEVFINCGGQVDKRQEYIKEKKGVVYRYDYETFHLPRCVQDWLGIKTFNATYGNGETSLERLNDDYKTFLEIAEFIEASPAGLFNDK